MRILLAAPDRDFLLSYEKLLNDAGYEPVTVFDGTQVLYLMDERRFDLAVLDRGIPRVDYRRLVRRLREAGIPVIVLTDSPPKHEDLLVSPLPNAWFIHPFRSEELFAEIRDVRAKADSTETFPVGDVTVFVKDFLLGTAPVTSRELDLLAAVTGRAPMPSFRPDMFVGALNYKLIGLHSRARIQYAGGKGYELVMLDE